MNKNEIISKILSSPLISFDIETKDPDLISKGPGCYRNDSFVCGVAVGCDKENSLYLSFAHPDTPQRQRQENIDIARTILQTDTPKLGANLQYDKEWLATKDIHVGGKLHDVQFAEPLLNEYANSYSLESLAGTYGLSGKKSNALERYCDIMGWDYSTAPRAKNKAITFISDMPERVAGEYALRDIALPLEIFKKQKVSLQRQGLWDLYNMETDLIPMLVKMRQTGVPLDMPQMKKTIRYVTNKHFELKQELDNWAGTEVNYKSSFQLAKILDKKGISYPRNEPTPLMKEKGQPGNPNLDKESLSAIAKTHPVAQKILDWRTHDTTINLFLIPYLDLHVNERLHCSFNALRSDDYGTVSGRFSSSKPNLQQVSGKSADEDMENSSEVHGKLVRRLFVPEPDHDWAKVDYSQVEYRMIAHYAVGNKSEELRELYRKDKRTDFHGVIEKSTGFGRSTSKRLNFGGAYGMGVPSCSRKFGWTMDQAKIFMETYHRNAPYIRETRAAVSSAAKRRGYIFTLMGRRARTHPSRKLHSMFNRLIQGSSADVMKKAMLDCWNAGVFDVLRPYLTVHDELDTGVPKTKEGSEALKEMVRLMETPVDLSVPLLADCEIGPNWAEVKEVDVTTL